MSNYKKMYYKLFNRVSDVIDELKEIQKETEKMYIESNEPTVLNFKNKCENPQNH